MSSKYYIKNWSQYNKSLINRGSITFWFDEESIKNWYNKSHTQEAGRPRIYSDEAILCALTIKVLFKLPYRSLFGFLCSLVKMLGCMLDIPSYTQISRRAQDLWTYLPKLSHKRPTDIVFDATGLKVFGEGEWKVKVHGISKRRTWRKLHIGMDPDSKDIIVSELTPSSEGDGKVGCRLMQKAPRSVEHAYGDGAYDDFAFRKSIHDRGAIAVVPPPTSAIVHDCTDESALLFRNESVLEIAGLGGDKPGYKCWKILHRYHKRSLAETTMYRLKQITGKGLSSRLFASQRSEAYVKCLIINKMNKIGLPAGIWERVC